MLFFFGLLTLLRLFAEFPRCAHPFVVSKNAQANRMCLCFYWILFFFFLLAFTFDDRACVYVLVCKWSVDYTIFFAIGFFFEEVKRIESPSIRCELNALKTVLKPRFSTRKHSHHYKHHRKKTWLELVCPLHRSRTYCTANSKKELIKKKWVT